MPRPRDPRATEAVLDAAMALLAEKSFAAISVDEIARRAGVGKPALYRRFRSKEELVATAIGRQLPPLERTRHAESQSFEDYMASLVEDLQPPDPAGYAGLIGGLMAEHRRHPELIEAFRTTVLHPRRALVRDAIRAGQREGALRSDLDADAAIDMLGGAFLARAFAGLPMTRAWRRQLFQHWWRLAATDAA